MMWFVRYSAARRNGCAYRGVVVDGFSMSLQLAVHERSVAVGLRGEEHAAGTQMDRMRIRRGNDKGQKRIR